MSKQSRFWVWTSFEEQAPDWDPDYMSYMIYQREICPDSAKKHYQGYVEFIKKIGLAAVKSHLGRTVHAEIRKGTQEECIDYCSKEESRCEETKVFGKPSGGQGTRSDLNNVIELIQSGSGLADIYNSHPMMMIRYGNGINNYINYYYQTKLKSWRCLYNVILWGEPGSGKTKFVYDNHPIEDIYKLTQSTQSIWFDGYTGQKVLLIDDFEGWLPYNFLLNILDGYPLQIPIKGSTTFAQWTTVYITSNKGPGMWFSPGRDEINALKRRVSLCRRYRKVPLPEVDGNTVTSTPGWKVFEIIDVNREEPKN